MTNSLQNRAIKKVIWEISIIVTFNVNPRKTDFSLKKSQNQKKYYKVKKLCGKFSTKYRCIKKYYTWSWDIDGHSLKVRRNRYIRSSSYFGPLYKFSLAVALHSGFYDFWFLPVTYQKLPVSRRRVSKIVGKNRK